MVKPRITPVERHRRAPLNIDTVPIALLDDPLEYILADHVRQRSVCAALHDFADQGRAGRAESGKVTAFLTQDRLIHHADEEEDLFPAVRRRSLPEDDLGALLARLCDEHRRSDAAVAGIVAALSAPPDRDPIRIGAAGGALMQTYCADERRHLAIENWVVLVIAAIRLSRGDLRAMSRTMKARRGLPA